MLLLALGVGAMLVIRPLADPYLLAGSAMAGLLAGLLIEGRAWVDLPLGAALVAAVLLVAVDFLRVVGFPDPFGSSRWLAFGGAPVLAALLAARDLIALAGGAAVGRWVGQELWGW